MLASITSYTGQVQKHARTVTRIRDHCRELFGGIAEKEVCNAKKNEHECLEEGNDERCFKSPSTHKREQTKA